MITNCAHLFYRGAKPKPADPQTHSFLDIVFLNFDNFHMETFSEHSRNTYWIENLAQDEINMEESGIVNFSEHLDPMHLLESSSIEFMENLKEKFEFFTEKFNELRVNHQDKSRAIKMFKISNTVNDFMLFRNSLKLVVARRSPDVISIGFLSNSIEAIFFKISK